LWHFNIFYQKVGTTWEWIFLAATLKTHNFVAETRNNAKILYYEDEKDHPYILDGFARSFCLCI